MGKSLADCRSSVARRRLSFLILLASFFCLPSRLPASDERTLVILANLSDQSVTCSVDTVRQILFDPTSSVDALLRDASQGQVSLSGNVVGPFTLSIASTDGCDLNGFSRDAEAAATAAGVDVASYPRRVYVLPQVSSCPAGNGSMSSALPSYSWVFTCGIRGTYAHNIGHNLGLNHAATAAPEDADEYGDDSDPMAWVNDTFRGFNAPHRIQKGWLTSNQVQPVTQDGDYAVAPLATDPTQTAAPQVLTIRKPDTDEYYYLSYRAPIGFDRSVDPRRFDRLMVHRYKGDGSSTRTYRLAMLADGESYSDPMNGITVSQVAHSATGSTARVRFTAACRPGAPLLTVSPADQTGAAGGTLGYSVTLQNTDTDVCPASTWALAAALPSGWTGTSVPSSLALAPGASAVATSSVTAPVGTTPNIYTMTMTAADASASIHSASQQVSYSVLDTVAPSAPSGLTLRTSQKQKQPQLFWTASTDNVAVAGYRIWKNGVVVATSTTTTWTDGGALAQTDTYWVTAFDAAGNVSQASTTVASATRTGGKR